MTPAQVAAGKVILQHVLPAQAQTQVEDVTPQYGDPRQVREKFERAVIDRLMQTGMSEQEAIVTLRGKPQPANTPEHESQPVTAKTADQHELERARRLDA